MIRNTLLIVQREYNERVRKKSFIITTLLMPLLMLALVTVPALIMMFASGDEKQVAVIDRSGIIFEQLHSSELLRFERVDLSTEEARRTLSDHYGVLYIGEDVVQNASSLRLYVNGSSSIEVEQTLRDQIAQIIEGEKLKQYHIENLDKILKEIHTEVSIQVFRNDFSQEEDTEAGSSIIASGLGYFLGFLLYTFLLMYGQMVMQAVIEEKSSRVLEVLVSSIRPFELMLGKILGVASVALTQIVIWTAMLFVIVVFVVPMVMPQEIVGGLQLMQEGAALNAAQLQGMDPDLLQALATVTNTGYLMKIFGLVALFLVGGFLFYSAIFAAIGSAVESVQDAAQLQTPVIIPFILALMIMLVVIKDPTSQLAFWTSIIPFTSPIVMIARVPYEIPMWEVILSLVLLYGSMILMVWLSGKIYRVGIFMYGKKPTLKEIIKWMNYKY